MVHEFEPRVRLPAVSTEPTSDPLSPSLSAPPLLTLSLSLSKLNIKNKEICSHVCKIQSPNAWARCYLALIKITLDGFGPYQ